MGNWVKSSDIYRDVLRIMDNKSPDAGESTVRNLRKKLDFLIERVALRKSRILKMEI